MCFFKSAGDIGFDPFGFKPKDAKDFANMQTKELNNGRLAMIGAAVSEIYIHVTVIAYHFITHFPKTS
jgi:hypothetical protein